MKQPTKPTRKPVKKAIKKISALDWYVINTIKKLRIEKGYSQVELSFQLNYSDSFISQMESDQTPAHYNISHLNAIAKVLKCSLHDFFPKYPISEEPKS